MRRPLRLIFAAVLPALLAACSEPPPPATADLSRPVKTLLIDAADTAAVRNFPARIAAAQTADLAFRVPGSVQELPVKEGDRLQTGDLVATLDPTDFQIIVNDRQATFDKARKNFERGKQLVDSGTISQVDFDRLEAEFKNARAALKAAKQDLSYTQLKAPFDGMIAQRLVDRFEEVQAKQAIAVLQNVDRLEVKFDVPEAILRSVRANNADDRSTARESVQVTAAFDDRPNSRYPLTFKEIATRADTATQTFEVTYLMDQWDGGAVLPGMTASVTVDLGDYVTQTQIYTVPVSAVVGDYKLDPRVWVVDESNMTVTPRSVRVGRLIGNGIEIIDGLEPGVRIVTAGTPFLTEDMSVTLMPNLEQAAPRTDDLKHP